MWEMLPYILSLMEDYEMRVFGREFWRNYLDLTEGI